MPTAPTLQQWANSLYQVAWIEMESSVELVQEINAAVAALAAEAHAESKPALSPIAALQQIDRFRVAPINLLHALGKVTAPPVPNLAAFSATWAERRYIWVFDPVRPGPDPWLRLSSFTERLDFHQKTLLSADLGVAVACYVMETFFPIAETADATSAVELKTRGAFHVGRKWPDLVCTEATGPKGYIVECKGNGSGWREVKRQLVQGTRQVTSVRFAPGTPTDRFVLATEFQGDRFKVHAIDPPGDEDHDEADRQAEVSLDAADPHSVDNREANEIVESIEALTFSSRGQILLVRGRNDSYLFDSRSGRLIRRLDIERKALYPNVQGLWGESVSVMLAPNSRFLFALREYQAEPEVAPLLSDVMSGKIIAVLRGHTDSIRTAAFSPDSKYLVTGSGSARLRDCTARLWSTSSGQFLSELGKHNSPVLSVMFSPDGKSVLVADHELVHIYDVASGELRRSFPHIQAAITSAAYSPDGKWVIIGDSSSTAILYLTSSPRPVRRFLVDGSLERVGFSEGNRHILTWSSEPFFGSTAQETLSFPPNAAFTTNRNIRREPQLWNRETGQEVTHPGGPFKLLKGDDAVIVAPRYSSVRIQDLATGAIVRTFEGYATPVQHLELLRDVNLFVARGDNLNLGLGFFWFEGRPPSQEEIRIAAENRRTPFQVWDVRSGRMTFSDEIRDPYGSMSSDGRYLQYSNDRFRLEVLNAASGDVKIAKMPIPVSQQAFCGQTIVAGMLGKRLGQSGLRIRESSQESRSFHQRLRNHLNTHTVNRTRPSNIRNGIGS